MWTNNGIDGCTWVHWCKANSKLRRNTGNSVQTNQERLIGCVVHQCKALNIQQSNYWLNLWCLGGLVWAHMANFRRDNPPANTMSLRLYSALLNSWRSLSYQRYLRVSLEGVLFNKIPRRLKIDRYYILAKIQVRR